VFDYWLTAPTGGTVLAPGGHGTCGAVAIPGVVEPGVVVPVPVPWFLGCVDVPVPAPAGTHGGFAIGWAGVVVGVLAVVLGVGVTVPCGVGVTVPCGVGVTVPCGVGAVVPDGVGATVPDGVGAVVPDGVGAVEGV
jgi:hypothetical protein